MSNTEISFEAEQLIDYVNKLREDNELKFEPSLASNPALASVCEIALRALSYRKAEPVSLSFIRNERHELDYVKVSCPRCGAHISLLDIEGGKKPQINEKPYCSSYDGEGCGQALRYGHVLRDIEEKLQELKTERKGNEEEGAGSE